MPTTKSSGNTKENETNKKMGTSQENRPKENTKGHSKQQQHGQNQKSHNK